MENWTTEVHLEKWPLNASTCSSVGVTFSDCNYLNVV